MSINKYRNRNLKIEKAHVIKLKIKKNKIKSFDCFPIDFFSIFNI